MLTGEHVRPRGLILIFIVGMLALGTIPTPTSSQSAMFPTEPGIDWYYPETHSIFLNGTEGDEGLDRILPPNTGLPPGDIPFIGSGFRTNLLMASSEPATDAAMLTGNLTVRLFAGLEVEDTAICTGLNNGPWITSQDTTFIATVRIGNTTVMDDGTSESIALEMDWNHAHEFTITGPINEMLDIGESIILEVDVVHNCIREGHLLWGTYDLSSGLQIDADLLTPSLNVSVDQNGATRIEFTPHSPFGEDDYKHIMIDIIGPLNGWDQGVHYEIMPEEEMRIEHLEDPPHGSRQTETGRQAWTWVTNATLESGMYVIDFCAETTDGLYNLGTQGSEKPCHLIGVLRFEVGSPEGAWMGSGWFAAVPIISTIGLLGWMVNTRLPPWPALVVIGLLMLSVMGSISAMPALGPEEMQHENAAPNFTLLTHGGGKDSLSNLLDGKDALVLGVFMSGSPSADLQMDDFLQAKEHLGDSVSFAQLITGESVEMYDGDPHAIVLNGTWPLLIDESGGDVAKLLPTGVADGVVIIDSAGFIVNWHPSTMNSIDIEKSVEEADSGGGRSPLEMFALSTIVVLLPLLILGLPTERIEAPEDVLIPGAGWVGTIGAASIGYSVWALPVVITASLTGAMLWTWIQIGLILWMLWQGVSMIIWEKIPEIDWISKQVYSRLPDVYRAWRTEQIFVWDTRMGVWLAWLSWIAMPTLLAQCVGARIAGGGWGFITGPLMLILFIALAGIITLLFRIVAAWGGPISRLAGSLVNPVIVRSWGVFSSGIAIWLLLWFVTGPMFIFG
jgi:hypothetical protein